MPLSYHSISCGHRTVMVLNYQCKSGTQTFLSPIGHHFILTIVSSLTAESGTVVSNSGWLKTERSGGGIQCKDRGSPKQIRMNWSC